MPLTFGECGLLTPEIQNATLREVEDLFGRMQKSDCRIKLYLNLERWLHALQKLGWHVTVVINGSFVMQMVDEPNDIDIILVVPEDWDPTIDLTLAQEKVLRKSITHKEYRIEVKAVLPNSEQYLHYVNLYHQVRHDRCREFGWPLETRNGMVRLCDDPESTRI